MHTGSAREVSAIQPQSIAGFFQNGAISEKSVTNAIAAELRIGTPAAMRYLTTHINTGLRVYENTLLYAKLMYYVLLQDEFAFANLVPQPQAYAAADATVNVVDISGEALGINVIPDMLVRQQLIMIDGNEVDITNPTDWQILRWIAAAGMRIDGMGDPIPAATPHACYVEWPAIPVNVLAYIAGPQAPAVALVNAQKLMEFAVRLANKRMEWHSLCQGLYAAMDIIGTRLVGDAQGWWPLRSCLSPSNPVLPAVADYNFMLRLVGIFPQEAPIAKAEVDSFMSLQSAARLRAVTLYTAVLTAATTTLVYDINLTAQDVIAWGDGAANVSQLVVQIMSYGFNTVPGNNVSVEPALLQAPRRAFKLWLGVGVASGMFAQNSWGGNFGQQGHYHDAYAGMLATAAPRMVTPWCSSTG